MTTTDKQYVIALEEHYVDPLVQQHANGGAPPRDGEGLLRPNLKGRLDDLGEVRLRAMDAAGIDFQVISHIPSPVQQLPAAEAVELARGANDRLHNAVDRHPDRFAAFAALPTPDPQAAVVELERTVSQLGFKGAMMHGRSGDLFHDDHRFWPIFERAQQLDVPIYLHPGPPHPAVAAAYYADYLPQFPLLNSAAWGYTIDTANQALRLILSGLFDAFPDLKIILGHMGEALPFLVDRMDEALKRPGGKGISYKETFCRNFYVTTSGHFSTPALLCTLLEMGIDHLLFSVDWPFVENEPGMKWVETVPLSPRDRQQLLHGNARRLLKL